MWIPRLLAGLVVAGVAYLYWAHGRLDGSVASQPWPGPAMVVARVAGIDFFAGPAVGGSDRVALSMGWMQPDNATVEVVCAFSANWTETGTRSVHPYALVAGSYESADIPLEPKTARGGWIAEWHCIVDGLPRYLVMGWLPEESPLTPERLLGVPAPLAEELGELHYTGSFVLVLDSDRDELLWDYCQGDEVVIRTPTPVASYQLRSDRGWSRGKITAAPVDSEARGLPARFANPLPMTEDGSCCARWTTQDGSNGQVLVLGMAPPRLSLAPELFRQTLREASTGRRR